jgi:parvulin-like peptidyl-prolyl isomerase
VLAAPPGKWIGPIASMYGLHLVRVQEKLPAELPTIEILRARTARELLQERAGARLAVAMQRLRAEYDIRIDLPRDSAATADSTTLAGTR